MAIPAREKPDVKAGESKKQTKKLFSKEYLDSLGKIQLRRLARQQKLSDVPDAVEQLRIVLGGIDDPSEKASSAADSGDASSVASVDVASDSEEEANDDDDDDVDVDVDDDGEERDLHASETLQLSEPLPLTTTVTCPIQEGGFQTVFAGGGPVLPPQDGVLNGAGGAAHRRFYNIFVDGFVEGVPAPFGKTCGLRDGDVILSVNGVNTLGEGMVEVFQPELKAHFAKKTTPVVFGVHRPGAPALVAAADSLGGGGGEAGTEETQAQAHAVSKSSEEQGARMFSDEHLQSLGQIQLKKLARQNGLDLTGGPTALRARLGALRKGASESSAVSEEVAQVATAGRLYSAEYLSGLGRVRLLKLGRQHGIDANGDLDSLRERLTALPSSSTANQSPAPKVVDTLGTAASSSKPEHAKSSAPKLYSATHLKGLGQIQLRKLAKKHGLDAKGGPATLRVRLGALRAPAPSAGDADAKTADATTADEEAKTANVDGDDHSADNNSSSGSESEDTDTGKSATGDTTDAHDSGAETTDMDVGVPPESNLGKPK